MPIKIRRAEVMPIYKKQREQLFQNHAISQAIVQDKAVNMTNNVNINTFSRFIFYVTDKLNPLLKTHPKLYSAALFLGEKMMKYSGNLPK